MMTRYPSRHLTGYWRQSPGSAAGRGARRSPCRSWLNYEGGGRRTKHLCTGDAALGGLSPWPFRRSRGGPPWPGQRKLGTWNRSTKYGSAGPVVLRLHRMRGHLPGHGLSWRQPTRAGAAPEHRRDAGGKAGSLRANGLKSVGTLGNMTRGDNAQHRRRRSACTRRLTGAPRRGWYPGRLFSMNTVRLVAETGQFRLMSPTDMPGRICP